MPVTITPVAIPVTNAKIITSAFTEVSTVTFPASYTVGETIILAGLTFTVGASGATGLQVAVAFSNLTAGLTAASLVTSKAQSASTGGTFTAGTSAGWTTGANSGHQVVFTSVTAATDVANLADTGTAVLSETISITAGATGTPALTAASYITLQGVTNSIQEFARAGCVRITADGFSVAAENDPKMLVQSIS